MKAKKIYKSFIIGNINMSPGDLKRLLDESFFMNLFKKNRKTYISYKLDSYNLNPRYGSYRGNAGLPINSFSMILKELLI